MATRKIVVELFYDIISPYSFLSFELLSRYRHQWNSMQLKFRPFLLGGIMKEAQNKAPLVVPNKARYMPQDLNRINQVYKIPIVLPSNFIEVALEKTSLKAQRFVTAIDIITKEEKTEEVSRQLYRRVFVTHSDITLPDSFRSASKEANVDPDIVEKAIVAMEQNEVKERLKKYTNDALSYGAFGAPTIVVHLPTGPEIIFGSDRMEIIASLLGEKYVGPLEKFSKL